MSLLNEINKLDRKTNEKDLIKVIEYDFKDEFAGDLNNQPDSNKNFCDLDDLEKWLIYKSSCLDIDCDSSKLAVKIYERAFEFLNNAKIELQVNKKVKYEIKINQVYRGETLNSFYNPLFSYLSLNIEKLNVNWGLYVTDQKYLRSHKFTQYVEPTKWASYLLKKYRENKEEIEKELIKFARLTQTMGNFMPVPLYFNQGRVVKTSDYWDLTLLGIYNYYLSGKSSEFLKTFLSDIKRNQEIVTEQSIVISYCEKWLANFKTWNNFVIANYLHDFVSGNEEIGFGKPIMYWDMHSYEKKDPKNKEDISQFIKKVNFMISNRGRRILFALINKKEGL